MAGRTLACLVAFLSASPAAGTHYASLQSHTIPPDSPWREVEWDSAVPGQADHWQAWSELIRLKRQGHRDFVFCAVPKAGCTIWKQMMLRASGKVHWNTTNKTLIHSPVESGLDLVGIPGSKSNEALPYDPHEFYAVMGPKSKAYKAVIVRDPAVRLLSSYLDRCIDMKEWARCLSDKAIPFEEVIARYEKNPMKASGEVDIHFRNQSHLCGLQYRHFNKWTFVGKYDDFINASERILRDNGLWDDYGASGWGPDSTSAFGAEEQPMSNHLGEHSTEAQMCNFYTPELLDRVREIYRIDYERFDFSINQWKKRCQ